MIMMTTIFRSFDDRMSKSPPGADNNDDNDDD